MKIHYSPTSPYVRKCMVVARELGLEARIEKLPSAANPVNRDASIVASNPLGKVPTFFTDDGQVLYDSRVVCEYLNELGNGSLFPKEGSLKWKVLTEQSLADGILDAALLIRYENAARPEEFRWSAWTQGQMDKIKSGLSQFEKTIGGRSKAVDIGTLALACALGYLDFRFADYDWRAEHRALSAWYAEFSKRPSVSNTALGV